MSVGMGKNVQMQNNSIHVKFPEIVNTLSQVHVGLSLRKTTDTLGMLFLDLDSICVNSIYLQWFLHLAQQNQGIRLLNAYCN
jgi:hypothetical protein